jgi:hypothetical protein
MAEPDELEPEESHSPEQLREYLHCWTLPDAELAPNQVRALLAWSGTPEEERAGLKASLAATDQQVPVRSPAPNQRRAPGWLERIKGLFQR